MTKSWVAPLFYFSTLISSIGSLTFNLCMIAFMLNAGFHLGEATLILGLQRLIPAIIVGIWGHITDSLPPRLTVVFVEVMAAVLSTALFYFWDGGNTHYLMFASIAILRAALTNFQTGSRVKITKMISDSSYEANAKHAIWFNKATQGATLFSGLIAAGLIKYSNFETAIIFDALTFVLNGMIVYFLPIQELQNQDQQKAKWHQKFSDLFKFNPTAAKLDLLLALSMMGTVAFQARVAGVDQSWAALFSASYGLAVWTAGFAERSRLKQIASSPFWILLGISYLLIGFFGGANWLSVLFFFAKDLGYWLILHRISGHIQTDTPTERIGGVTSARMTLMVVILSLGEVLVGAWASFVPVWLEGVFRFLIVLAVGIFLLVKKSNQEQVGRRERAVL
jgi:hypothetical protein